MTEPVELYLERRHAFKKKPKDPATGKKRIGCEHCNRGKSHPDHLGAPPSLNEGGSGLDRAVYQALKRAWMDALASEVRRAGLASCGWESVYVEAQIGFPDRRPRDEGNIEWMLKKALGDVLQAEGVIPEDCFYPVRRYTMGNLEGVHSPGRSWTRLLVFESVAEVAPVGMRQAVEPLPLTGGVG